MFIQEVVVAKSALITCGWKDVNSRTFAVMPTLLNIDCGGGVPARLDILPGLLRAQSCWLESSLLTLLQNFGRSKATDPRDIVYALLGLSRDTTSSDSLRPDCQLSVEEVTQRTVAHLMLQAHDLPEQKPIQSLPKWDMNEFYTLYTICPSTSFNGPPTMHRTHCYIILSCLRERKITSSAYSSIWAAQATTARPSRLQWRGKIVLWPRCCCGFRVWTLQRETQMVNLRCQSPWHRGTQLLHIGSGNRDPPGIRSNPGNAWGTGSNAKAQRCNAQDPRGNAEAQSGNA